MKEALTPAELAELLENTHNLILHGAPGTGKTHLAKEIAKEMKAEWKLVQFHPSYDYTDFVEGIRPKASVNGSADGFERKDGVFKEFCKNGLKENDNFDEAYEKFLENIRKSPDHTIYYETSTGRKIFAIKEKETADSDIYIIPQTGNERENTLSRKYLQNYLRTEECSNWYYSYIPSIRKHLIEDFGYKKSIFVFIIDEINRGELSKIFGELFYSIDPSYRGTDGRVQTQYQNLVPKGDVFEKGFYVPENVYIIGTMNDIDRSVESMDFAMRRRFTFKEIKAADTQKEILCGAGGLPVEIQNEAVSRMDSLNKKIESIGGLSSDYHIGAAYFLKLKELNGDFEKLWEYHLEGLLQEYLRGMEDAEKLLAELNKIYVQFVK